MKTTAAVLVELGKPLELVDLEIPPLGRGQALVKVAFSGVCHTQLLEARGYRGPDKFLPHCLGHEGSGTVVETGPGVTRVKAGDRVVLSWIKGEGLDASSTVYRWDGKAVNAGAITTFSRLAVISENRLSVVAEGLPMRESALLGCAAATGVGAVFNTAKAAAGQSVAVFGAGGIGLCAVMGAAAAGCSPIIVLDVIAEKLEAARKAGATHVIAVGAGDPVEQIRAVIPGGPDLAVEASGRPAAMMQALRCVRNQGGAAVVIGNARHGEKAELDPKELNMGKRLLGTWGGDTVPARDFPRYAELLRSGQLPLKLLTSKSYPLEKINEALGDLEGGRCLRPLVEMEA